jgi:hypothetical protein
MRKLLLIIATLSIFINGVGQNLFADNALYFRSSGNATDGLPWARLNENWGIRFNSPDPRWVFSSKPSVLIGYVPAGQNWGNDNLLVAGDVGVGTTTPQAKLHVNGNIISSGLTVNGTLGIGMSNLPWIPTTGNFEVRGGGVLGSFTGSNRLLTCTSIGAAGSATNYYQNNIWVTRDATGSDWLTTRLHNGISIDGSYLTPGVDTRTWWERSPFKDIQSWGNGNQTYLTINQGNVGIGTNTPGSFKLAVNGKVWAQEVQVALSNPGPDYVFEPTYDLKSLAEIETYIKENKTPARSAISERDGSQRSATGGNEHAAAEEN